MERLIDQGSLYVAGLLLLAGTKGWVRPVLAALLALIYIAVSNYVESGRVRLVLSAILTVGCCFLPGLLCFLPLVCYDCVWLFLEHMRFFYIGGHRAACGICAGSWEKQCGAATGMACIFACTCRRRSIPHAAAPAPERGLYSFKG